MVAAIGGILAEFIAAAYFYLYNRSLSQLNYFFDKLTAMQDTKLAIKLCENLPEPNSTAVKEQLIILLLTRNRVVATKLKSVTPEFAIDPTEVKTKAARFARNRKKGDAGGV